MDKKLLKIQTVVQHPDLQEMSKVSDFQIRADLDYAVKKFNMVHDGKFKIIGHSFNTSGRWMFEFIIEVPKEYEYTFHIMRAISKALYHDKNWSVLSTVPTRLFTVVSTEELQIPLKGETEEVKISVANDIDATECDKSKMAVAKITIEVVGSEAVIVAIKNLISLGNVTIS